MKKLVFNPTSGIPTPGGGNKGAAGKPLNSTDITWFSTIQPKKDN